MQVEMFREGLRFVETLFFQQHHAYTIRQEKLFSIFNFNPSSRNALTVSCWYYENRESVWNVVRLRTMFHHYVFA